jgi:hypothetical protein
MLCYGICSDTTTMSVEDAMNKYISLQHIDYNDSVGKIELYNEFGLELDGYFYCNDCLSNEYSWYCPLCGYLYTNPEYDSKHWETRLQWVEK